MSGVNKSRMLSGVADLSKLTSNKRKKLSKLFRDYNTDQTSYSQKVLDRKEVQAKDFRLEDDEFYSALNQHSKLLSQKYKNKSYKFLDTNKKNDYLDFMASRPEIKEALTKMCNELIVTTEDNNKFAEPKLRDIELEELGFEKKNISNISDSIKMSYNDFYKKMGMSRNGAWNHMYDFLKKGKKAWEIIYDNVENPKRILHFVEVDPNSLEMFYDNGERFWIHTPKSVSDLQQGQLWNSQLETQQHNKKTLYDHQIIYISWTEDMVNSEHMSYLEQLIKPYNMMRIIDETKIIWAVTNSTFRTLYSIPTANQGRNRSEQTVTDAMEMYKDHYNFDNYTGDISINGENNLMFAKDMFMSNGDSGSPEVTVQGGEGFDLSSIEPNEMFQKKFYRATNIPLGRFDSSSQETWNLDPTSIYREEMEFDRYKGMIRNIFGKSMIKPVLYQLVLDVPELHDEPDVPENVYLEYTSYSIFHKLMELEMLKVQFESVEQIRNSLTIEMGDGSALPMLPMKYIFKEYLGYDDDKLNFIEKMRLEELEDNLIIEKKIAETRKRYNIEPDFGEDEPF